MTERHSGALAILGALQDAGLDVNDVDGICRYFWQPTTEMEMARIIGVQNMKFFGEVDYGGGAGAPVVSLAAMAIELGLADVVVVDGDVCARVESLESRAGMRHVFVGGREVAAAGRVLAP